MSTVRDETVSPPDAVLSQRKAGAGHRWANHGIASNRESGLVRRTVSAGPSAKPPLRPPGSRERAGSPWLGRDSVPSQAFQALQQLERQLTPQGLLPPAATAPVTAAGALADWWVHLLASPAKQWELAQYGLEQWRRAWGTD